jgi:hypothetical protein
VKTIISLLIAAGTVLGQAPENELKLKSRTDLPDSAPRPGQSVDGLWILPAGTRIPIALRQPISTKGAKQGDPIYAQTTFPIVLSGNMAVPAGTWVQGIVDNVKRAGRLKGTAELQFHLTKLIYANGYTLDIQAAIDQVPGDASTHMKEPNVVKHDSEKGKDLERVGTGASQGGQVGALAGAAASRSIRGLGYGGLTGVAAGTLIAMLARGSDVRFDTGTAVEIALNHPMAIEPDKIGKPGSLTPQ